MTNNQNKTLCDKCRSEVVIPKAGDVFNQSRSVWSYFQKRVRTLKHERFWVCSLDVKLALIGVDQISQGTLTAAVVHPREVYLAAVKRAAHSVILVHNHPSGDTTPSREDDALTARLRVAGEVMGISVLDHVIVSHEFWHSYADSGNIR